MRPPFVQIVASPQEHPAPGANWGHGGWQPPEDREALDWLTLVRLMGWSVRVLGPGDELVGGSRVVIVACELSAPDLRALEARLQSEPLLLVVRVADASAPTFHMRRVGCGTVAELGFHPSAARDEDGAATKLLRDLLVDGLGGPAAWLDFSGTLVLRMDDPGGAQNVHCKDWSYLKLGERDWAAIATELRRRNARLSVLYTPGWVDDGEAVRGTLFVGGVAAKREPGAVWDSALVRYEDAAGNVHDYVSERRGIDALRSAGLGQVELHGHTHIHPDLAAWAVATDRYETIDWYRELGRPAAAAIAERAVGRHPLQLGTAALERTFGVWPTTLVPPGDQFADDDLHVALDLGFRLVDSYYLALRDGDRFCWCQHVCAPYLDLAGESWLDAELPVVGYFHDNDVSLGDIGWLTRWLDAWQEAGVERLIDFRELAGALARRVSVVDGRLVVETVDPIPLVRPLPVRLRCRGSPEAIPALVDGVELLLCTEPVGDGDLRVRVPLYTGPTPP